jgi:LacI family transcriptional regulator
MARATVHDLARAAGVSLATVDRVLNRRGGVRAATIEKVEQAVDRLGYRRDVAAATLATQREYRFAFVIPTGVNSFLASLALEVRKLADALLSERVFLSIVEVPHFDGEALADALGRLRDQPLSGVAVVATDHAPVRLAVGSLAARGFGVVTLVSDAPGSGRAQYVGIDNSAAGRTAGSLMGRFLRGVNGHIAVVAGSMLLRDHAERRFGFEQVLRTEYPNLIALPAVEGHDNAAVAETALGAVLDRHRDIVGVYSLGAGNRGVLAALRNRGLAGAVCGIAHELTEHSRAALADGSFAAIICQDPGHEARSAVRILRALADGLPFDAGQERIRIDIYMRDNVP